MKTILQDFDGVIFDCVRYIADFKSAIVSRGVSQEALSAYFKAPSQFPQYASRAYSLIKHPEIRREWLGELGIEAVDYAIETVVKRGVDYVFPDAWDLLKVAHKSGRQILFTQGAREAQELKVVNSGVCQYFDHLLMGTACKGQVISEFLGDQTQAVEGWFLDDRGKNLTVVKQVCPNIRTILVWRENGAYNHENPTDYDHKVENLDEARRLIYS